MKNWKQIFFGKWTCFFLFTELKLLINIITDITDTFDINIHINILKRALLLPYLKSYHCHKKYETMIKH